MSAKTLMVQGTGSDVGKSLITAALCRYFYRSGYRVAPFKAQNMSLNSCVTADGGEIGRAQAYQAEACGLAPHVSMNPILLKPSGDNRSQVVVMGKATHELDAKGYFGHQGRYVDDVDRAFFSLKEKHEIVILEGAGSPAEINLRHCDLVNMPMAHKAEAPVLIVGDIDRGGVFAWMKGTWDLLLPEDQKRVAGFIINKFRGDLDLLTPGIREFESMVNRPVLGVVPFDHALFVDEEDALPSWTSPPLRVDESVLDIAVLRLPRISNFTDFAPLAHDPSVHLRYVWNAEQLGSPDMVILPGTKNTLSDCLFLRKHHLDTTLLRCLKQGTMLLGICGGFQMMGRRILDPHRVESNLDEVEGLQLFDMDTTLEPEKTTRRMQSLTASNPFLNSGIEVEGYEIHNGLTQYTSKQEAWFQDNGVSGQVLGIFNKEGTLWGTYLHGLFDKDEFRNAFLNSLRIRRGKQPVEHGFNYQQFRQHHLDKLADLAEQYLDMNQIKTITGLKP